MVGSDQITNFNLLPGDRSDHFNWNLMSLFRIDSNVTETQMNVEAAHTELLKYFKGITSNRWLMIKIFAVIIVFFVVFIIFMT